ncbi:MAG TPA: NAD(P)/FAD-dependent oxidoreductase [Mycobacterium sp.]|jgi:glutathione reductase (NADPH)|nr:NAD(P)/FAD-dependent oxidoreductase [Mycobacterium sp.]
MTARFDLIVIGAGMAGIAAANKCAAQGWSVAIIDSLPYGGTCALRGCDPKKILRRGAEIIDAAQLMRGKGIDDGQIRINWSDLMRHKRGFTDPAPANMEHDLRRHGVHTLHGQARFVDAHQISVGDDSHQADRFLVAAGARPRPLQFSGQEHLIDSTEFLDLEILPPRIVFVGGGYISFEFAHIAARAGSHPIILDHGPRPLKGFDPDLVDLLIARSQAAGIQVQPSTTITAVRATATGYQVQVEQAGTPTTIDTDLVVHGAGRIPALAELDLDHADIAWSARGISVEPHLQSTTHPGVYAAGDAAATVGPPLTPVAVIEGKVAASNVLKDASTVPDYTGIPSGVFTIPDLARVGLLETEARDQGFNLDVRYTDASTWYSSYRIAETTAAAKILVNKDDDRIVGAHLLGPDYTEHANTLAVAIKLGLTTRHLKTATAAYPTLGSDLGSML